MRGDGMPELEDAGPEDSDEIMGGGIPTLRIQRKKENPQLSPPCAETWWERV